MVPWPYLSPALLTRIMTEVPLVIGVKQSAGDLKLFADLMTMAPDRSLIYSAVDALMYPSYTLGAHGPTAAILTAAPHASVALWDAAKAGDHPRARPAQEALLTLRNAVIADNLPACTRYAQMLQGLPQTYLRAPIPEASARNRQQLEGRWKGWVHSPASGPRRRNRPDAENFGASFAKRRSAEVVRRAERRPRRARRSWKAGGRLKFRAARRRGRRREPPVR